MSELMEALATVVLFLHGLSPGTEKLKELVKKSLDNEIEKVLQGNNNDVERRYKHYVENSPSESKNILEKEDTDALHLHPSYLTTSNFRKISCLYLLCTIRNNRIGLLIQHVLLTSIKHVTDSTADRHNNNIQY
jgi:hypothetical protein